MRRGPWCGALLLLAGPAAAQVRVGVEPAVVTVGEPFHLVAESPATSLGAGGQQVLVRAAHQGVGPAAVNVPQQYFHTFLVSLLLASDGTPASSRISAAKASSGLTLARQG